MSKSAKKLTRVVRALADRAAPSSHIRMTRPAPLAAKKTGTTSKTMPYKHTYMVITTTFALEPLLNQYRDTYPNGDYEKYQVVFKSEGEWKDRAGEFTYIVVFTPNPKKQPHEVSFQDFIGSYCKLNKQAAIAGPMGNIFPYVDRPPGNGRAFGAWKTFRE